MFQLQYAHQILKFVYAYRFYKWRSMYSSSSQFDGNAAFSGGGFMPSQATQGTDPSLGFSKVSSPLFFLFIILTNTFNTN